MILQKVQLAEIGNRLRTKRNSLGFTREQFAELADIGAGFYGQIEVGATQMSIDTLVKVSRTSRLTTDYILFGDAEPAQVPPSIYTLLESCTPRQLRLAEKMLQLFLLRSDA